MFIMKLYVLLSLTLTSIYAASKDKPHSHQGVLNAYDGKHITYSIDAEQTKKLNAGEPVTFADRTGKSGRGVCLQDIEAPPDVCMDRIRDLPNYHKMVSSVKSINIYHEDKFTNGTIQQKAEFKVGISFFTFTYYLTLTYEPKYKTFTWTLDYQYSSDLDDNTGHWQVLEHPTKPGWTRVLYSTEVKVFSWIPEFVVNYLTKTALIESTTWVRKESEAAFKKLKASGAPIPESKKNYELLKPCFTEDENGSRYDTKCSEAGLDDSSATTTTSSSRSSTTTTNSDNKNNKDTKTSSKNNNKKGEL